MPSTIPITVSGITDGTCSECVGTNGTWNLNFTSFCTWETGEVGETWCGDAGGFRWHLQDLGGGTWALALRNFAGASRIRWECASFDSCATSNTFTKVSTTPHCGGGPEEIILAWVCAPTLMLADTHAELPAEVHAEVHAEVPAYLINLKRRPDRLKNALEQFAKTKIMPVRFDAVDGILEELPLGWNAGHGAWGCNRSHVKVLEHALSKGQDTVMVFEDDVEFAKDFDLKFKRFMEEVPEDWDALFLGGQFMTPGTLVKPGVIKSTGENGIHRTHAYILRGEYLKFMLSKWNTELGHVDHVWGRNQKDWNVYAPEHWLCAQTASKSDINGRQLGTRWWEHKKTCGSCANRRAIAKKLNNVTNTTNERRNKLEELRRKKLEERNKRRGR